MYFEFSFMYALTFFTILLMMMRQILHRALTRQGKLRWNCTWLVLAAALRNYSTGHIYQNIYTMRNTVAVNKPLAFTMALLG
jgi:hypothetical protein